MSDPNKYINYYVENSMSMVHEYINTLLQTKTQLRVLEDQVKEKDAAIASLQNELESHLSNKQEVDRALANATTWENSFNDMKNKVSHMDTITNQVAEAKKILVEKNAELNKALGIIENLKKQAAEKEKDVEENYVQGHNAGFKPGAGPGIQNNQPIEELVLQKIKPTIPKPIKAKTKTSSCRAGQVQTGVQTKDGKLVPKCSIK